MSGESFSVNTEGLHGQMPYMQELAQRFRSVHDELEARLGALGEPWGEDVNGEQFLRQYAQPRQQIVEAADAAAEVLNSSGDGIETMARGFQRIEAQNMEASRHLGGSLSSGRDSTGSVDGGPKSGSGRP